MKRAAAYKKSFFLIPAALLIFSFLYSCASRSEIKAEEFFSIGMAYYELGQNMEKNREKYFAEAEKFLNRARSMDKTMTASDYNLGIIAFETGRYEEAVRHFERILGKDSNNVMALKAAAYSRIKNGDLEKAEAYYVRVLELVPESADDGYNYALVLYGLKKFERSEEILKKYPYALEENAASILLFARAQREQKKIEAIDSYAKWVKTAPTPGAQGLYEYARVLENSGLYAKALEQYSAAIKAIGADTAALKKSSLMFEEARLFLAADPGNAEGIVKLNAAVTEGFSDLEEIGNLLNDERITNENKSEIRKIMDKILNKDKETENENNPEQEQAEEQND